MRFEIAADLGAQKAAATVAAASGVTAWVMAAQEVVMALLGVPLPVILAAAIGAFGAQSFLKKSGYVHALGSGILWTLIGTASAALGLWLATFVISTAVPAGALTGAALIISAGGRILFTVDVLDKVRDAIIRKLDNIGRRDGNGNT